MLYCVTLVFNCDEENSHAIYQPLTILDHESWVFNEMAMFNADLHGRKRLYKNLVIDKCVCVHQWNKNSIGIWTEILYLQSKNLTHASYSTK